MRLLKEGTDRHPKWYATVVYAVPVARLQPPADGGELGVDRNVGQATDSDGEVYAQPDTSKLDANIKRKQRRTAKARERSRQSGKPLSNRARRVCGQLRKLHRKKKRRRANAAHQHSRKMADTAHTVVVEDLNLKAMTQSAKGTVAQPGTNVKAKAGLNREILASGWGRLERNLAYQAGLVVKVDPAYTSQTCAQCGHVGKENRKTRATFQCTACGYTANADRNAAVNILDRGFCTAMGVWRGANTDDPDRISNVNYSIYAPFHCHALGRVNRRPWIVTRSGNWLSRRCNSSNCTRWCTGMRHSPSAAS